MAQFEQPHGTETAKVTAEIRRELRAELPEVPDVAVKNTISEVGTALDDIAVRLRDATEDERTARMKEVTAALKPLAEVIATGSADRERVTQETIAKINAIAGIELTGVRQAPPELVRILERGNVAPNEVAATLAHIETEANDGTTRTNGNRALAAGFDRLARLRTFV